MKRSVVFAGMAVLLTSITAFASSASIGVWDADIQGTIKSGADGDKLGLRSDLGMGDDNITQWQVDLNLAGPKTYLRYYKAENRGITNSIVRYNGITLHDGPVRAELEQRVIDFNTGKTIMKTDALQVDLLGGLRYMDLNARLQDNSHTASDSVKALVPTIGIGAQTHLSSDLVAKASISGLDISFDGKKIDTYDLKYGLEYKPTANIAIGAGVLKSKLFADDGENTGELRREGNYFELVIKF